MPIKTVLRYHYLTYLFWILIFYPCLSKAQICNGSFGDPVVNLTFGQGNTGPSSFVPSSGYTYINDPCPNDGYYTIANSITNCYGDTWQHISSDHTGGGNFMLVNASFQPGDFFLTTVTDLCPNTTYEFSAWVMNVMKPLVSIKPNITFHIEKPDGTVLASFDTGDMPVTAGPEWKKYGFLFSTPVDNATIMLRLTNNAPGGYGNDLALDDISFRPCGAKISAGIQGSSDTVNVCEGNQTVYTFSGNASSVYQSPVYHWQLSIDSGSTWNDIPGADNTTYVRLPVSSPGGYRYRLTVVDASVAGITSCRIASNLLIINVHPKPVANAGPDRVYIKGIPITISAIATGENISFTWSPQLYMSDTGTLDPTVTPPYDIIYSLFVQSSYGCTNKDSMKVTVVSGIYVPNAFSPNGDGKNDYWRIPYLDIGLDAEVNVFNRWGQLVYHVSGATVSWDGKLNGQPQDAGVYVYVITFKKINYPKIKGTFTLIR
ncbi:MAG: gliding motility-associated C-terminal domain-containing protein [Chitinophagales bacterium]